MVEIIIISVAASFATVFFKFNVISSSISIISDDLVFDPLKIFFKVEELGFFNLEFPIEYGLGDIMGIGKDIIYRNVHLFV